MKIFNREMGGGKTTALLELMWRPENRDVIYVAPTMQQARMARQMYDKYYGGNSEGRFISSGGLKNLARGRNPVPRFVIDEFDGVIGHLISGKVVAVAGTDEDLRRGQLARILGGE